MKNGLIELWKTSKTIFTAKDLALLWSETNKNNLKAKIAYYTQTGDLLRLRRGVFARAKDYDIKELATSIYTPSYISLETVLAENGIIFQYYGQIFVVSYLTRTIECDGKRIEIRKIKDEILANPAGIINLGKYSAATPERAFLDRLYLSSSYHFDNLHPLNWEKCFELVKIYDSRKMNERLNNYYQVYVKQK